MAGSKEQRFRFSDNPRENVSLYEALAFTRWFTHRVGIEVRLPTEAEWQAAATGGQNHRLYPWGETWIDDNANTLKSGLDRTTAAGIYLQNIAPCGAMDMCGNVEEWTITEYDSRNTATINSDKRRVLRGGSWKTDSVLAKSTYRFRANPDYRNDNIGFRICSNDYLHIVDLLDRG